MVSGLFARGRLGWLCLCACCILLVQQSVCFAVDADVDRVGGDFASLNLGAQDYGLCQQICNADGRCRAWTYGDNGGCWIKNAAGTPKARSGKTTGVRGKSVEYDADRVGGDLYSLNLANNSPALCERICMNNPQCRAWSYSASRSFCWIKNSVPRAQAKRGSYSGVK